MLKKYRRQKGVWLLEMLISVVVMALVAATVALVFDRSLFFYRRANEQNQASQEAQIALEWLARDISSASCFFEIGNDSIGMRGASQGYVRYYLLDPHTLVRTDPSNCATSHVVSENIESLIFKYFDAANQETLVIPDMKTIEIALRTSSGAQAFDLYTVTKPFSACILGYPWEGTFGGSFSDTFKKVFQTSDGGFIFAGSSQLVSNGSGLVVKTDPVGAVEWAKIYYLDTMFSSIQTGLETSDGGFIFGLNRSVDGHLIKTDSMGNIAWVKKYSGTGVFIQINDIKQTTDGGYILAGCGGASGRDLRLVKTDASGTVTWAYSYGTGSPETVNDILYAVEQTSDGGYICGGGTKSFVSTGDCILFKTDSAGLVQWAKTYGNGGDDYIEDIMITPTGDFVFGGVAKPSLLVKTDSAGNKLWARWYKKTNPDSVGGEVAGITLLGDGSYVFANRNIGVFGVSDYLLIKTTAGSDGATLDWAKAYGGPDYDYVYSFQSTSDGGYAMAGTINDLSPADWEAYVVRTDSQGGLDCCAGGSQSVTIQIMNSNQCTVTVRSLFIIDSTFPTVSSPSVTVYEYPDSNGNPSDDFPLSVNRICPNP